MIQNHLQIIIVFLLCLFIGCQSAKQPDGLPELVPFRLSLTQNGQPLSGASVLLFSPDIPWTVTGTTDTKGTAPIVTYGKFFGSPQGKFKVVVIKNDVVGNLQEENRTTPILIYSLVDPSLRNQNTTTLEVTVEKGKKSATLDVGKPVRVLIDTIQPNGI
ncbi:MAG: hypothetical protein LBK82_16085 [Planctomycetaceae bacterium]|jgi:hypothetical protein|nr:hypothetical protein [Planctomycetaceae bacterium]